MIPRKSIRGLVRGVPRYGWSFYEVEYALRGIGKPIGVAEWQATFADRLAENLKSSLPTIEEIEAELARKRVGRRKRKSMH